MTAPVDVVAVLRKTQYEHERGGVLPPLGPVITAVAELIAERDRLHALVNNPLTESFLEAVRAEVAHQVERWGTVHDRAKEPEDWLWLVGYLSGKALRAHIDGDEHKALHHTISTAAVLANWHAHIVLANGGSFTPGASDLQKFLLETFGSALVHAVGGDALPAMTHDDEAREANLRG